MQALHFYCGAYHHLTDEERKGLIIVGQTIETPKQMSDAGKQLLAEAMKGDYPVRVFCNHEDTFNGLRVAVSEYNDENVAANVFVTFVDDDGTRYNPGMNARGGLRYWPHNMHHQIIVDMQALS